MTETILLSLDPGLLITGYAVLLDRGTMDVDLLAQGTLAPKKVGTVPDRIEFLCQELEALLNLHTPNVILIEWDSGHINTNRHKGGGAGLATHGAATASLWREALYWTRARKGVAVVTVPENEWTRGVPKEARAIAMAQMFPGYDWTVDSGYNAADAIGLAVWRIKEVCVRSHAV